MESKDIWDDLEAGLPGETLGEEMFEFISAYADGECTPKERRLVEAYLAENADGRRLLADLRAQASLAIAEAEPPAWLRDAILAKTSRKRRTLWPAFTGVTSAAAASIAVWLAWPSQKPIVLEPIAMNDQAPPAISIPEQPKAINPTPTPTVEPPSTAQKKNRNVHFAVNDTKAPVEESPVIEAPKTTTIADAPNKKVTISYALIDNRPSQSPQAPDTVSLVTNSEAETSQPITDYVKKDEEPVMTDAREKLRERLKKVNQENSDIKEAVRSTT